MLRLAALALTAALAACAPTPPPEAGAPEAGAEQTLLCATATVLAVDPAAGSLRLRDATDGSEFTVTAPPGAADLHRLRQGDVIMLDYFASAALEMAAPGDPGEQVTLAAEAPTPVGTRPGGAAARTTSLVVEFLGYDRVAGLATVRGPEGRIRSLEVPPTLAAFAAGLSPGDRVQVTLTEALAVSVTPADT